MLKVSAERGADAELYKTACRACMFIFGQEAERITCLLLVQHNAAEKRQTVEGRHLPDTCLCAAAQGFLICQDQSMLCICLSLGMKKYCKLKYSRCDLYDGSQTLNTHDQRGIYNLPIFPRFVRKASSLSASLPPCPSPCTDLSCGDPRAVRIIPI